MKITEVRIFPTKSKDGRLKAYATMTFDDWFVVRNVKIIQGNTSLFVAMPSRKAMDSCRCGFKNARGSKFCNECGAALPKPFVAAVPDEKGGREGDHMDIAHPIKQECRVYIQDKILQAFNDEMKRKEAEGVSYKPVGMDDLDKAGREPKPNKSPAPSEPTTEEGQDIEL